jgi:hypothetical protein
MKDRRLARTKVAVRTDGEGRFNVKLPVLGSDLIYELGQPAKVVFWAFHPDDQVVVLRVSSEGYVPQTVELPLTESRRDYSIDVKLVRAGSDKSPD